MRATSIFFNLPSLVHNSTIAKKIAALSLRIGIYIEWKEDCFE